MKASVEGQRARAHRIPKDIHEAYGGAQERRQEMDGMTKRLYNSWLRGLLEPKTVVDKIVNAVTVRSPWERYLVGFPHAHLLAAMAEYLPSFISDRIILNGRGLYSKK